MIDLRERWQLKRVNCLRMLLNYSKGPGPNQSVGANRRLRVGFMRESRVGGGSRSALGRA
jgi:hypothetical protein